VPIVIGVVAGGVVLIIGVGIVIVCYKRRQTSHITIKTGWKTTFLNQNFS
jgi:NADH:ubiquinone oxidoreductase subunit K